MKRRRAPAPAVTAHVEEEDTDNPYELERAHLIKRNREVLATMGLLNVQPPAPSRPRQPATSQPRAKREKAAPVPQEQLRRSKRAQGIAAEDATPWDERRDDMVLAERNKPRVREPPRPSNKCADEADMAAHNKYRMSYMGDDALRRRIHKISNIPKMRNFVQLLKADGKGELAQEAEEALAALLARA